MLMIVIMILNMIITVMTILMLIIVIMILNIIITVMIILMFIIVMSSRIGRRDATTTRLDRLDIFSKAPQGNERGAMGSKNPPAY